ncbi:MULTISPECIES: transporter substrate-binding domain-containing protein [Clostridia]|uniref:Transporter substrate-binding domain-containing protein n=2 Tax=Clostridia TaxID=186801 RepID=A0A8I0A2W3_9CLOT|nr:MULTISPECIES: transporter substrate-binding domain-containing protein [Clostridia]MBC5638908.1 transporter substrate-binding domain-containing protein [Clostridium lentum]MBC5653001.1 transporter substrate-binding domain-containing protein [Blautia lenta]
MKKGIIKNVIVTGLISIMAVGLAGCGNSATKKEDTGVLDSIKESGKLVVGLSADYAPYEFHIIENGQDKIVGFDVSLAKEIADELDVELEIKEMDFDALITALPAGKVDMVISGMNPTEKRKKAVDFSDIYYTANHGILVRAEDTDKYTNFSDLDGLKVGAQLGSTQAELASTLIKDANLQLLSNVNNLILELKSGKVDAVVMEVGVAQMAVKNNPELAVGKPVYEETDSGNAIAIAKGNEDLVKIVNGVISRITEDGTMNKYIEEATILSSEAVEE